MPVTHLSSVHGVLVADVEVVPQKPLLTRVPGVTEAIIKHLTAIGVCSRGCMQMCCRETAAKGKFCLYITWLREYNAVGAWL